jgi:hypothetical protein
MTATRTKQQSTNVRWQRWRIAAAGQRQQMNKNGAAEK